MGVGIGLVSTGLILAVGDSPEQKKNNNVHFKGVTFICGPHLVIIGPSEADIRLCILKSGSNKFPQLNCRRRSRASQVKQQQIRRPKAKMFIAWGRIVYIYIFEARDLEISNMQLLLRNI